MKYTIDNIEELRAELKRRTPNRDPAITDQIVDEDIRPRLERGMWVCDYDHGDQPVMVLDSWPQKCSVCYYPAAVAHDKMLIETGWVEEKGVFRIWRKGEGERPKMPPFGLGITSWT